MKSKKNKAKNGPGPEHEDNFGDFPDKPGLINFPHHIGSAVIKPEDKGKIKGRSLSAMREQTDRQLARIYEHMKLLARQVNDIKKRVEVSERIYEAQINFEPVIGQVYHLYERENGEFVLSMISEEEWGGKMRYKKSVATIRLLSDHTWEILPDK